MRAVFKHLEIEAPPRDRAGVEGGRATGVSATLNWEAAEVSVAASTIGSRHVGTPRASSPRRSSEPEARCLTCPKSNYATCRRKARPLGAKTVPPTARL